jgi:hypothetical protein
MEQVEYLGQWVSKEHFRAWVYNATGRKIANTWDEFAKLIDSGLWFASQDEVNAKPVEPAKKVTGRKPKNDANS